MQLEDHRQYKTSFIKARWRKKMFSYHHHQANFRIIEHAAKISIYLWINFMLIWSVMVILRSIHRIALDK